MINCKIYTVFWQAVQNSLNSVVYFMLYIFSNSSNVVYYYYYYLPNLRCLPLA